jgi:hypothetical protein
MPLRAVASAEVVTNENVGDFNVFTACFMIDFSLPTATELFDSKSDGKIICSDFMKT